MGSNYYVEQLTWLPKGATLTSPEWHPSGNKFRNDSEAKIQSEIEDRCYHGEFLSSLFIYLKNW